MTRLVNRLAEKLTKFFPEEDKRVDFRHGLLDERQQPRMREPCQWELQVSCLELATDIFLHAPTVCPGLPKLSRERVTDNIFQHGLEVWQVCRKPTPERSNKACPLNSSLVLPLEAVHGVLRLQNLPQRLDHSTSTNS